MAFTSILNPEKLQIPTLRVFFGRHDIWITSATITNAQSELIVVKKFYNLSIIVVTHNITHSSS